MHCISYIYWVIISAVVQTWRTNCVLNRILIKLQVSTKTKIFFLDYPLYLLGRGTSMSHQSVKEGIVNNTFSIPEEDQAVYSHKCFC
jgi:hypothetical protein